MAKVKKARKPSYKKLIFKEGEEKFPPRDYQRKHLDELIPSLKLSERGQAIMPCGSGKTALAYWAMSAMKSHSTLILCPSLFLVNQIYKFFAMNLPKNVNTLCVCSAKDSLEDSVDSWDASEFIDDLNPTTDPKEIVDFIKMPKHGVVKKKGKSGYGTYRQKFIIISTYQSSPRITEAFSMLPKHYQFQLAICDEAHRTAGKEGKQASDIHYDEKIRCQRRLYMTATPKVSRYTDSIVSMSDSSIFGEELTYMSFNDGIESGFLSDFEVQICGHKESESISDSDSEHSAKLKILEQAIQTSDCTHVVGFCRDIDTAKFCANNFNLEGFKVFHINGKMPDKSKILKEFSDSEKAIIFNARCLTEGVDVPNIDGVAFLDPKQSVVDIIQAIGRALRGGDKVSQIIIPLLQSDNDFVDDLIDEKKYKIIIDIVKAIMIHDERIVEYINDYSFTKNRESLEHLRKVINFTDLPQLVEDGLIKFTLDRASDVMPFKLAKEFVSPLNIKGIKEWKEYWEENRPKGLPKFIDGNKNKTHPWYKEWKGVPDFFGYSSLRQEWMPYEEAKKFARSLNLSSIAEWSSYCKGEMPHLPDKPENIPTGIHGIYSSEPSFSLGDFLGFRNFKSKGGWMKYDEAKEFVQSLGLKKFSEWRSYCNGEMPHLPELPHNIPKAPQLAYKKNWEGYILFLTGLTTFSEYSRNLTDWLPYDKAKEFARSLKFSSYNQWLSYCKGEMPHLPDKPENIPTKVREIYSRAKSWVSIEDFFDFVPHLSVKWMSYEEAKNFIKPFNFKKRKDYIKYFDKGDFPKNLPKNPDAIYKKLGGWTNWGDFLGYVNRLQNWLPFSVAVEKVRAMKIKSNMEYRSVELPVGIPRNPEGVYKDEWKSWQHYLGKEFCSYEECKIWVKKLNCPSHNYWKRTLDKSDFPSYIPKTPRKVYERLGTWKGWDDFLGIKA